MNGEPEASASEGDPGASVPVPEPVLAWAHRPGAVALLSRAREKVEAGATGDRVPVQVLAEHRDDVGRMLGVTWELSGKPVTLRLLREALTKAGTDLTALLVAVGGPLRDRPAERRQVATAKQALRSQVEETLVDAGVPRPIAALAGVRRWLGADPQAVVGVVASAWSALPSPPQPGSRSVAPGMAAVSAVGLAEFAGQELLDPHALDRDQAAGRATARLLAATYAYLEHADPAASEHGPDSDAAPDAARDAAVEAAAGVLRARQWRTTWARAGLSCDQVSSTVLVLNVPLKGASVALGQVSSVRGEPLWITERMTAGGCVTPPGWGTAGAPTGPRVVRVCENPSVIEAAANRLGAACPPLVCVYGRPSSAAWDVLFAVAAGGAQLLVSTDRDGPGEQIAAELVAAVCGRFGPGRATRWLPEAGGVYEEEWLEALLEDLAHAADD